MGDHSLAICGENIVDPGQQRAHFGINAWVVWQSTTIAPRDNTLQLPITNQRTTRVTLSKGEEEGEDMIELQFLHVYTQALIHVLCNLCEHT